MRSVESAFAAADAALWALWTAVLHAGPSVDDTEPIREAISQAQTIVSDQRYALRALARRPAA